MIYVINSRYYQVLKTGRKFTSSADVRHAPHMFQKSTPLHTKKAIIKYLNDTCGFLDTITDLIVE